MRMKLTRATFSAGLLLGLLLVPAIAGERRQIGGRVVDETGQPVAGADVDFFWRANGPITDDDGRQIDPATEEGNKLFWGRVGQMAPFRKARSDAEGRFTIEMPASFFTLMALDAERGRGGLATIPKGDAPQVEIVLRPLVRIHGKITSPAGEPPEWFHIYTNLPDDPTRPLQTFRLVSCGSRDATFAMSLPPGRYQLNIYTMRSDGTVERTDAELDKDIELRGDTPRVNLGTLKLATVPLRLNINDRVRESQASGAMGDYKKHYGEKLPEWSIVDVPEWTRTGDWPICEVNG